MRCSKVIKRYKLIFSYSGVSKKKIFLNIIRLRFYKLIGKRFTTEKICGNKMILDLHTAGISSELFVYGKRELLDTWIIMSEVKGNMNIIDIGGNIGYYPILEASLLDNGKVYTFEPDPRNIEILKENIKLNNFSNKIELYPYAVADHDSFKEFYLSQKTNLSSFLKNNKSINSIPVKCIKLDNFEEINKIDFIRMDIEGYECVVIAGMINFLRAQENLKLQIEVHPSAFNIGQFSFPEELKTLEKLGFRVKYLISAGVARPAQIIGKGYKPIKSVIERKLSHGLYENIKMEDLMLFLDNEPKIVRSILLEKKKH